MAYNLVKVYAKNRRKHGEVKQMQAKKEVSRASKEYKYMYIKENAMRENLKKARQAAGLTQKQVAQYLEICERHYKYMESGKVTGNVELWDKLEDLFNIHQRILRSTE